MFGFLKPGPKTGKRERAPDWVAVRGGYEFALAKHLTTHEGYPVADWEKVRAWVDTLEPEARRGEAWTACERGWLLHFRDALGADFRLDESDHAAVLSSLEPNVARATLARYYPETGEFAFSGGMHINAGCSHYVTVKNDLRHLEATIVHEMTHGCLEHLPLPAWLNEGLAVNTERRLAGAPRSQFGEHAELHDKLRRAARECLGLDLGDIVTTLLERETPKSWSPGPEKWEKQ